MKMNFEKYYEKESGVLYLTMKLAIKIEEQEKLKIVENLFHNFKTCLIELEAEK